LICNTENTQIAILPIFLLDVQLCLPFSEKTQTGGGRKKTKRSIQKKLT